ncbi:Pregnancy-associated glycoprotein 2 [Clonorchis sinensis]|uniref:Pregnancy-associated glycoprotein 2 n=1 Tax=Clonorchis sinensis TaxID=79923 RepID=A0A8T1LZP1_CLOSI|nr:Pregnancy-associated glycoprotein 2 [Clonorchis sinensis]
MLRLILLITPFWIAIESNNLTFPLRDSSVERTKRENGAPGIEVTLYDYKRIIYYGIVGFGTPVQYLKLQFDTGSPVTWVCNQHRVKGLAMVQNTYSPSESGTHHVKNNWYNDRFGNYIVSGYIASDVARVHKEPFRTEFAVVNSHEGHSEQLKYTDGLFGLAAGHFNPGFKSTALDDMYAQGLITQRMFAFVFKRSGGDGTVIFGGYSKNQIPGRVHYVPLVRASPTVTSWIIRVESITCEDGTVLAENFSALLDTGSSRSYLPKSIIDGLFSGRWAITDATGDITCDAMKEMPKLIVNLHRLHLSWYSKQYILQLDTGLCQPGIQAIDPSFPVQAILGLSFLRHYVTVFDVDNARVGFAGIV